MSADDMDNATYIRMGNLLERYASSVRERQQGLQIAQEELRSARGDLKRACTLTLQRGGDTAMLEAYTGLPRSVIYKLLGPIHRIVR